MQAHRQPDLPSSFLRSHQRALASIPPWHKEGEKESCILRHVGVVAAQNRKPQMAQVEAELTHFSAPRKPDLSSSFLRSHQRALASIPPWHKESCILRHVGVVAAQNRN